MKNQSEFSSTLNKEPVMTSPADLDESILAASRAQASVLAEQAKPRMGWGYFSGGATACVLVISIWLVLNTNEPALEQTSSPSFSSSPMADSPMASRSADGASIALETNEVPVAQMPTSYSDIEAMSAVPMAPISASSVREIRVESLELDDQQAPIESAHQDESVRITALADDLASSKRRQISDQASKQKESVHASSRALARDNQMLEEIIVTVPFVVSETAPAPEKAPAMESPIEEALGGILETLETLGADVAEAEYQMLLDDCRECDLPESLYQALDEILGETSYEVKKNP